MKSRVLSSSLLPSKDDFLRRYSFSVGKFDSARLEWNELKAIFNDYRTRRPSLEPLATYFANELARCDAVHATSHRLKDPESVIEKIVRRSIADNTPWNATCRSYFSNYPDLVGVRALHILIDEWPKVHAFINKNLNPIGDPKVYLPEDEIESTVSMFKDAGCTIVHPESKYQSVHYNVVRRVDGKDVHVEIQVRTLYQEAWGEVDPDRWTAGT